MTLFDLFLWPGTKVCRHFGIDPTADAGLVRWMINTIVYLIVSLSVMWAVMA